MAVRSSKDTLSRAAGRFRRVPVTSLHEAVVRAFCDALLTGRIKPGQRLIERDMAEEMGLSRGPIRDGLAALERLGLVVRTPHRASYVASLDAADIHDVYTVRRMFETFALRLGIERGHVDAASIASLDQLVAAMDAAAQTGDRVAVMECDLDFHRALCALGGSPRMLDLYDQTRLLRLLVFTISQLPHLDLLVLGRQHQEIVDALRLSIECGDATASVAALERHLDGSCQLAVGQIAKAGREEG